MINKDRQRTAKIAYNLKKAETNLYPISIQGAIVDKCFNDCGMCDHPSKPQFEVDVDDWCDFITKASNDGLESVCYSGGDPFAYKHINKVMECHIEIGVKFGMLTTGYLPKSVDIDLLKHSEWVRVSLDAVTPEVYDKVRGLIKVHKVLNSIDRMVEEGIEIGLSPTIHNDNIDDMRNVLEYAAQNGFYVDAKTAYPGSYPTDRVDWSIFDEYRDRVDIRVYTGKYEPFNKCSAVLFQLFIDSRGRIYPCCTLGGDTTVEEYINEFGLITDPWDDLRATIDAFSQRDASDRPKECSLCQGRFTEINHVSELIMKEGSFF